MIIGKYRTILFVLQFLSSKFNFVKKTCICCSFHVRRKLFGVYVTDTHIYPEMYADRQRRKGL